MINAVIRGTGSYLPIHALTNDEIADKLDTSNEWIHSRTGISSRYLATDVETTAFMAAACSKQAVNTACIDVDQIDLIIAATCTPDFFFPSTACRVKHELGIKRAIPAFDLGAACSGFIYAMDVAHQYLMSGTAANILVIGSERMSATVDWNDRTTCVLFGDGAGALILSSDKNCGVENSGIIASKLHSDFDTDGLLTYANATFNDQKHSKLKMRGNELFKVAVTRMGDLVDELLGIGKMTQADIDWLLPHQANIRIIKSIAKRLNLPMSRVIVTIEDQGNTSAASVPIALDNAVRNHQIKRGDVVLIEAFGGGVTWGGMLLRY